jgi:TatD DNase family protein
MRYFDAHTHVNFVAYADDRESVIQRSKEAGVIMNIVGTQKDTSAAAVSIAEEHEAVYATIGLHPVHTTKSFHDVKELGEGGKEFTSRGEVFDIGVYEKMARSQKTIAIGECGLDYYRTEPESIRIQKEVFIQHIELANTVEKPLMLHIRQAYEDALEILRAHAKVHGDVHFFAGDWNIAKQFLELGFTLSFTGVLTFTRDYDEVVQNTPLDMLLTETDAPYVTPVPYRGQRNEPIHVREVVKAIARIRGGHEEPTAEQLYLNAKRVFGI